MDSITYQVNLDLTLKQERLGKLKMNKEEKEMLAHLLNKAIEFDCFLIDEGEYYTDYSNYIAVIDSDEDVVMKEVE